MLQTPANMSGRDAHIAHDKFRPGKDPCIDALQDKVFCPFGIECHQESIIYIAVAEFQDINNCALLPELFCNGKQIVQRLTP
jgi:hypothetical protein